jgi:CubicO group peptidase (beta-lactamase class C family)
MDVQVVEERSTGRRRDPRAAGPRASRVVVAVVGIAAILGSACGSGGQTSSQGTTSPTDPVPSATGLAAAGESTGLEDPQAAPWPVASPEDHGLDPAALQGLADYLDDYGTDCTAIVKDGHLVDVRYWNGTTVDTNQEAWSISKSVTGTLVGIAQDEGLLDIDDRASMYIDEWKGTPSEGITIKNLLSNDSGRYWDVQTDLRDMAVLAEDKTAFAVALGQQQPPGEYWEYNSSAIQTLETVLREATGRTVEEFAQEKLFGPLGMTATILDDAAGNDLVFMGTQAGCLDLARFGSMILHDGSWEGDQIVSADWVSEATSPSQDIMTGYGYLWWLNTEGRHFENPRREVSDDGSRFLADAPLDLIMGLGLYDQFLLIDPTNELVFVRLGRGLMLDDRFVDDPILKVDEIFRRLGPDGR